MIRIHLAKIRFVLISAIYYNTIMFANAKFLTYIYCYFIPVVYLLVNNKWFFSKLEKIKTKRLGYIIAGLAIQMFASIIVPVVKGTNDFTYFLGPLLQIIKSMISYMFLLCMYEKKFGKGESMDGFIDTFIFSIVIYVIGTLIICIIPSLHQWIIDNMYITEYTHWLIRQSDAYSRIGWSGFSNFFSTFYCSIAVILCLSRLLNIKSGKKEFRKYNMLAFICLIGNLCYGRIGVVVSIVAYISYFVVLFINRPTKIMIYPIIIIASIFLGNAVIFQNQKMTNWFNWAFAQLIQYRKSGTIETYTILALKKMYIMPTFGTFIFGDGRYKGIDTAYYMATDVGWLRPIYFYGIVFSSIGFIIALLTLNRFSRQLYSNNIQRKYLSIVLLMGYILFESKGEIFYVIISLFLIFLLSSNNRKSNILTIGL